MKHGGDIYKYAKKLHCKPEDIIDFSSNINSYHPKIDIKLTESMIVNYGDHSYSQLRQTIADKLKIKKSNFALFNGATAAIFELFKVLQEPQVYLYAPLYGAYEEASQHKEIIKINRFDDLYQKPKKSSIVVFVNPSTPDGKYYDLKRLFHLWERQNSTIVLDESFLEFENLRSMIPKIQKYKKLYIIKSFTKFYSCAGVRIGAIISHQSNLKQLKIARWNLSSFDAHFLTARLKDRAFHTKSIPLYQKNKKRLLKVLKDTNLFSTIYASNSNFVLVKSKRSREIFDHLLREKIIVRTCGSFDFLDDSYLRFAVKDSVSIEKLKKALDALS